MGRGEGTTETQTHSAPARQRSLSDLPLDLFDPELPELQAMSECEQDRVHHPEGDVLTHTRAVAEELLADSEFQSLPQAQREVLGWAVCLHDVGKPSTSEEVDGRIISPGHARRGARIARRIMWERGVDPEIREAAAAVIRWHMLPFHYFDRPRADARKQMIHLSLLTSPKLVAIHSRADALGRGSRDRLQLAEAGELFALAAEELGCSEAPYPFASDHSRVEWFRALDRGIDRDPAYSAHDESGAPWVWVMSGLPGAGKDRWIRENLPDLPQVSLDQIRTELKISPRGDQGRVIAAARERAKEHLRRREPFVWNATNITRSIRSQVISTAFDYGARVAVPSIEVSASDVFARNQTRGAENVPESVVQAMVGKWEPPDLSETHQIVRVG